MNALLQPLFAPRRIALVGASSDGAKAAGRPMRYLRKHGFAGEIFPVNPRVESIDGERCYPSLDAIPGEIDHAYVMVATERVEAAIAACAARRIRVATILSDGFAESGEEGVARQAALLRAARETGPRLLGPNSMGIVDTASHVALSVNAVLDIDRLLPGRIGVVSQSGSLIGAIVSRGQARGIGYSKLVSVGNEADLTSGEIVDLLVDDTGTNVILLFLETLRDAPRLAAAARRADAAGKPIIAYLLGRSAAGRELAQSHTGAIVGSGAAFDAFLADAGIARVTHFEALIEAPLLFAGRRPAKRSRVAVATTTGGGGAMLVDSLGALGIEVPAPSPALRAALAATGVRVGESRLMDLTLAGARPDVVGAVLETVMASAENDAVVMVVGSSAQFHPELAVAPIVKLAGAAKPLAAFLVPDAPASLQVLSAAGVPSFRTAESAADAIAAFFHWKAPRDAVKPTPVATTLRDEDWVATLGIPVPRQVLVRDAAEARRVGLIFPVVAKIASADIPHKTEIGGVRLGIADPVALAVAVDDLFARVRAARPDATIDGVLVQEQARGLGEALIGFRRDKLVGPIVTVAAGGVLAEIYADAAVRLAPVDLASAREMIEEVRGLAPLRGYRGLPKGDLDGLARALAALSQLAGVDDMIEAEINPLIVRADGVVAVDQLLVWRKK
jgi:acyl-CoA synthetase (NDP forming)